LHIFNIKKAQKLLDDIFFLKPKGAEKKITFNEDMKKQFLNNKKELLQNYARLLGAGVIAGRFSKAFDADLNYKITPQIELSGHMIRDFNETITGDYYKKQAQTESDSETLKNILIRQAELLKKGLDEDLFINTESVKPDLDYFKQLDNEITRLESGDND
jgi:hypothetical protein